MMRKNVLSSVGLAVFGSLGAYCLIMFKLLEISYEYITIKSKHNIFN